MKKLLLILLCLPLLFTTCKKEDDVPTIPTTPTVLGCTDLTACNFDPLANTDNDSCLTDYGCTDAGALNYNPLATCDDGSCTDSLAIGDSYQGGVIFYLDSTGQHGFVCDFQDLGTAEWGCHDTIISGADETGIGKGYQNTIDIEAGCTMPHIAADYCVNSSSQGYSDWFLPSKDELNQMYIHKATIELTNGVTAFLPTYYWSSSESNSKHDYDPSWGQYFSNGFQYGYDKSSVYSVRAIRAF